MPPLFIVPRLFLPSQYGLGPVARDTTHPIASILWAPYQQTYHKVDMFYASDAAFHAAGLGVNAFGPSQSIMNLVEIALNVAFLALVRSNDSRARVIGIVAATMTASKTVLYFVMASVLGWTRVVPLSAMRSASEAFDFARLFLIPNGLWIVVPSLIVLTLGAQVAKKSLL